MAIQFPNGFDISSKEPIDARLVLSKQEMYDMKKANMPSVYFCVCSDDKQLYLYNDDNAKIDEIGRFRLFKTEGGGAISVDNLSSTDGSVVITTTENNTIELSVDSIDEETIQQIFNMKDEVNQ